MKIHYLFLFLSLINLNSILSMEIIDICTEKENIEEEKELILAAYNDNLELIKKYLYDGININSYQEIIIDYISFYKWTPLHAAIKINNVDLVKFLLENGADPNIPEILLNASSDNSYHPLVLAKNIEIFELLLKYKADPNIPTEYNTTLDWWARKGDINKVNLLLSYGANPNLTGTKNNLTALHGAIQKNQEEMVKLLVSKTTDLEQDSEQYIELDNQSQNNVLPIKNVSLLALSIFKRSKNIVTILLDNGADLNKEMILKAAIHRNNFEIFNKIRDNLFLVIKKNKINIFKKLMSKLGFLFKDKSAWGNNGLHYALNRLFIDNFNNTLLHWAIINKNINLIKYIWSIKPNLIAQKNKDGKTPLDLLIETGILFQDQEIMNLLKNK